MASADGPATAIDVNAMRDPAIRLHGLTGVDETYTFYYDETNNIRRLSVKEAGFNVREPQAFVLGGIVHDGPPRDLDFASLRAALQLQPNVRELKFERIAHGDFLALLGSRKLTIFLEWIEAQGLHLHYFVLDTVYWSMVDIIDSIIADGASHVMPVAPQLKNDLYTLLRSDLDATADLYFRYGLPDLQPDQRAAFAGELLDLLEYRSDELDHFSHYMLKGVLQMAAKASELPFIEGGTPRVLIEEFSAFFLHRICLFKNSQHILDDEDVVRNAIGERRFLDGDRVLDSYRFARSHDEPGIQISDGIVGLLGKCFSWLNVTDLHDIAEAIEGLNASQARNRRHLAALLDSSITRCAAFAHNSLSLEDHRRGALFLEF